MNPLLEKNLISTKDASDLSGYNSDYLARLCRSGKIVGTQVGRTWLVSQKSLEEFVKSQDVRKQELRGILSEVRGKEYQNAQDLVVNAARRVSPVFKSISGGLANAASVSEYLTHPAKTTAFQKQGLAVLGSLVVLLIGITVAQAAPVATLAARSFDTTLAISDGLHSIVGDELTRIDDHASRELASAAASNASFLIASTSAPVVSLPPVASMANSPTTSISSASSASIAVLPVASSASSQSKSFANIHSLADASIALARFEIHAYIDTGAYTYVAVNNGLSTYLNAINAAGDTTLALGTAIRDAGTNIPLSLQNASLALAGSEIGLVRDYVGGTQAIMHAYSNGVYAWVDTTPDITTRIATGEYQTTYGLGSALATAVASGPSAIVSGYQHGMNAWVNGTPVVATDIVNGEITAGKTVVKSSALAIAAENSAVDAGANLAYSAYQGGMQGGTVALAIVPNDASSRVASLRANADDAWLGALGNSSLGFSLLAQNANTAKIEQLAAAVVPAPAYDLGKQTALTTYDALHGLFMSATDTLAYLFGARPIVVSPTIVVAPATPSSAATASTTIYTTNNTTNVTYANPGTNQNSNSNPVNGVTTSYVDSAIQNAIDALHSTLAMTIINQVDAVVSPLSGGIADNARAIAEIEKYTNIAIKGSSFDGGTITNSTLSNVSISSSTFNGTNVTTDVLNVNGTSTFGGPFTSGAMTINGSLLVNGDATDTGTTTLNNAVMTNATSTNLFATNLVATNGNLSNLNVSATTSTGGLSVGNLNGFLKATAGAISTSLINLSTDVSNILPVGNGGTGTSSFATNGVVYGNGTNNLLTTTQGGANTVLVANNGAPSFSSAITVGTSINTPYLMTTSASTTNLTVSGNLYVPGSVASNLTPLTNNTYDLGSPELYYRNAFVDTLTVNSISAASTSIAGTVSPTFTLNSANATNDAINMSLIFFRGTATPNAVLAWDAINKYFNFNQLVNFAAGATTTQFTSTGNAYLATSGGKVGVGTSTPAVTLDVYGTDALRIPVGTTVQRPAGNVGYIRYNTTTHQFEGFGDNNVWQGLGGVINAAQTTYITAGDDNFLRFVTNGVERMTISNTGEVVMDNDLGVSGTATAGNVIDTGVTANTLLYANGSKQFTSAIIGNGLTFTGGSLSVSTSSLASGFFQQGGNAFGSTATLGTTDNNQLNLITNNLPRLSIASNGNVGIGTITPGQALDVVGNINVATGSSYLYNGVAIVSASTTLNDYFFGPSGNMTMTGIENTAEGGNAFFNNTTGSNNTAQGYQSLALNTTGADNTAQGHQALQHNGTGFSNTAQGSSALLFNSSGNSNTAQGYQALVFNNTGSSNTAQGVDALYANVSGAQNTGQGTGALQSNISGSNNTAQGSNSLLNTIGSNNTGEGVAALSTNTTGSNNSAIGFLAGYNSSVPLQTMSSSTFLGAYANSSIDGVINSTAIGYGAQVTASNQIVLGNSNVTQTLLNGTVTAGNIIDTGATPNTLLYANGSNQLTSAIIGNGLTFTGGSLSVSTSSLASGFFQQGGNAFGTTATLGTTDNNQLNFITNNSPRLSITNGGNVGIGTTAPAANLSIQNNYGSTNTALFSIASSTASNGSTASTLFSLSNTGNLTINNGADSSLLISRSSTNYNNIALNGILTGADMGISGGKTGDNNLYIDSNASTGAIIFRTNSASQSAIFNSSGNFGIGTTTPQYPLDVESATTNARINVQTAASGALAGYYLQNSTNQQYALTVGNGFGLVNTSFSITDQNRGAPRFVINTAGNIGIGVVTPTQKLDVAGNINVDQFSSYKQAGNTILYASTTNSSVTLGFQAGQALMSTSSVTDDVAIGYQALAGALGGADVNNGQGGGNNTAVGYLALTSNTTGDANVSVGSFSLFQNTTGIINTAIGHGALGGNTTAGGNTAIGYGAGGKLDKGGNNVAIGAFALNNASTSASAANTVIGDGALDNLSSGGNNVIIGDNTGNGLLTNSNNNIIIGEGDNFTSTSVNNQLDIGNLLYGTNIVTNGSAVSTGNIGIGTSTPFTRLQVENGNPGITYVPNFRTVATFDSNSGGGTEVSIISPANTSAGFFFGTPASEATGQLTYNDTAGNFTLYSGGQIQQTFGIVSTIGTSTAPSSSTVLTVTPANGTIPTVLNVTNASNASLFNVLASGNVGIGTSTPTNPLTLPAGSFSIPSLSFGDTATGFFRNAPGTVAVSANGTIAGFFSSSGFFGGGSHSAAFETTNASATFASVRPDQQSNSGLGADATGDVSILNSGLETLRVGTGSTELLQGNFGIGTTTPGTTLSIADSVSGGAIANFASTTSTFYSSLSRPAGNPKLLVSKTDGSFSGQAIATVGRYVYSVSNAGVIDIYDVSNPASPIRVGTYSIPDGSFPTSITILGKYAYITDQGNDGVIIVDISNPAAPVEVGADVNNDLGALVNGTAVGNYMYVGDIGNGALEVINVANPTAPKLVGSVTTGITAPYSVAVQGKYAYVANTGSNLDIYDISNPVVPVRVGVTTGAVLNQVYVSGRFAYVTTNAGTLIVYDISNPASPTQVGTLTGLTGAGVLSGSGKYVYVTVTTSSISSVDVVDVSNPAAPVLVGTSTGSAGFFVIRGLTISGRYAYANGVTFAVAPFDLGGTDLNALTAQSLEAGSLNVDNNITALGDLSISGINVGTGGIFSSGPISAGVASSTQANAISALFQGFVGIGTTTPGSLLSVGSTNGINFSTATSTFSTTGGINLASGCFAVKGVCLGSGGGATGTQGQDTYIGPTGTEVATSTIFISPAGNVGINNNAPLYPLDVTGVGHASAGFSVGTDGSSFTPSGLNAIPNYGTGFISSGSITSFDGFGGDAFYTNQLERMRITQAGNVGIGTSTPQNILSIQGLANFGVEEISGAGSNGESDIGFRSTNVAKGTAGDWLVGANVGTVPAGTFDIWAGGINAPVLSISPLGNVGIGTTTPGAEFAINTPTGMTTDEGYLLNIASSTAGVSTSTLFSVQTSGALTGVVGGVVNINSALNCIGDAGSCTLFYKGSGRVSISSLGETFNSAANSGNSGAHFSFVGSTDTSISASVDAPVLTYSFGNTRTHATGAIAEEDDILYTTPIDTFAAGTSAASVISTSSAFTISGAPQIGARGSATNAMAFLINPGPALNASTTNAYAFAAMAPTGATNNYAAEFLGGNVGIGTTTPGSALSVEGNEFVDGNITANASLNANTLIALGGATAIFSPASHVLSIGQSGLWNTVSLYSGNTEMARVNATGLGVGTTTPGYLLSVAGTGLNVNATQAQFGDSAYISSFNAGAYFSNSTVNTSGVWTARAAGSTIVQADASGYDVYVNGSLTPGSTFSPVPVMQVNAAGLTAVGIGNSPGGWSGNQNFSVASQGTSADSWGFSADVNGGTTGGAFLDDTTNTSLGLMVMYYNHSAQVGSIYTNGSSVSYNTTSDRRLKENITPTAEGLALLQQIPVDDFNYISQPGTRQQGYIAQDLYNYYPIAVHVGGADPTTDPWSVDYGRLTPLIISSVQQLATGYSLNDTNASSTVASWYAGVSAPAIAVDAAGNVGIGTGNASSTLLSSKIVVNGNASVLGTVYGNNFVATGAGANFATMYGSVAVGTTTAASVLSTDGKNVDVFKLATFALSGVQQLEAQQTAIATQTTSLATQVTSLSQRVSALEAGAAAGLQNASSTDSSSILSATSTELASALESFGVLLQDGIAQFNTLVVRNLVFSKDSDGTSAAGSGTVLAGNTTVEIDNADMLSTSQVSVTLTSPLTGNWYVSNKQDGSFRVTLSSAQTADVTFDYVIIQTQGQIATSTPTEYLGSPFSWINALFGGSSSTPSNGGQVSAGLNDRGSDSSGATGGTATSTVGAPSVVLIGAPAMSLNVNDVFIDPGATAHDAAGSDISSSIQESGSVDTATPGIYTLTYTATDGLGATGSVSRVVTVSAGGTVSGDTGNGTGTSGSDSSGDSSGSGPSSPAIPPVTPPVTPPSTPSDPGTTSTTPPPATPPAAPTDSGSGSSDASSSTGN